MSVPPILTPDDLKARIAALKAKLAASKDKPGLRDRTDAIAREIARLEAGEE